MEEIQFPVTAKMLGELVGATLVGDDSTPVRALAPLKSASSGDLSFLSSKKHATYLDRLEGAVIFTRRELVRSGLPVTFLVVSHPQAAFAEIARRVKHTYRWLGVSEKAVIHPDVTLGEGVSVGPFAVVSPGVCVGKGSVLGPFVYVGSNVQIGEDCEIGARVTLLDGVIVGNRVKIFPGAVIGSDGFGFFQVGPVERAEMPQIGTVVIEDDVRIGANTTIDRATLGRTRVGLGTKIDDQVHVGHNVEVGAHCVLCGQAGIAGSAVLEDGVMLGGQAGINDGVTVGKGANVGGQTGVTVSLKGDETYFLTPAIPIEHSLKVIRCFKKLPDMYERLKQLEKGVKGDSK